MNRDPTAREWLRVVKYFKAKLRARNGAKGHNRPSVRPGNDAPKGAKGC
jgi:hypothetical protein